MYGYKKKVNLEFEDAINKVIEELQKEGFGVLTKIDVKETLKKKINVDYNNYVILGACNPSFAHKALQVEKDVGLLLPCNVIIYKDKDKVKVSAILPKVAMSFVNNIKLKTIAIEIEKRLKKVVDSV